MKKLALTPVALAVFSVLLVGCNDDDDDKKPVISPPSYEQPKIDSRVSAPLEVEGLQFRDSNRNGKLEPFEDWRLTPEQRAKDIVNHMTLKEKAGMMMIDTMNAGWEGAVGDYGKDMIQAQHMTRFIFRNPVTANPKYVDNCENPAQSRAGCEVTPQQAAEYINSVQELRETTGAGIPAIFKSNARNHVDPAAKAGINVSSGAFSAFPKEAGLAATRDMDLIYKFAETMNEEWAAIGLRSMYGYMLDLATEPRWYRTHETFTEDAELMSDIVKNIISGLQGSEVDENSIALTLKHFPGGGPQEDGGDPHYEFGMNQVYPGGKFDYHFAPFKAAIDAGASSIMPYYGIPVDQRVKPNDVGMSFSKGVVSELLRGELGFTGNVNSDTGIIGNDDGDEGQCWGLCGKTTAAERVAVAIDAGVDVLSGFKDLSVIDGAMSLPADSEYKDIELTEERINLSVERLIKEQFQLGLFENPYVDAVAAAKVFEEPAHKELADTAQKKSVVLLKNGDKSQSMAELLPLQSTTKGQPTRLYMMGFGEGAEELAKEYGFTAVVDGSTQDLERTAVPMTANVAVIRVRVDNNAEGTLPNLFYGGANPDELNLISFTEMASAQSWNIIPKLADIQAVINEIGKENVVLSVNFRQPFVLDEASGMNSTGALLATFGVSDKNLMEVLSGNFAPTGKLPYGLSSDPAYPTTQFSDLPSFMESKEVQDMVDYPYGHGLTYEK